MRRLVLGAGYGKPAIVIMDVDTGEVVAPVSSPLDEGYAFDHALARDGWVAVNIGYQVAAYRDGDLLRPTRLPDAWQMFPATEPDCILLRLYHDRSRQPDEDVEIVVVDGDGNVRRSGSFPAGFGCGEVVAGVLGRSGSDLASGWGIRSWANGAFIPLDGSPLGVLGGHVVVLARPGEVVALDTRDGTSRRCQVSGDLGRSRKPSYDGAASRLALTGGADGVLVADLDHGPRWIPGDFSGLHGPVWLGTDKLLFAHGIVQDVATGATTRVDLDGRRGLPSADVTGRFEPEEARAVFRAPNWSPPTPAERNAALSGAKLFLEAAAKPSVAPLLEFVAPTVRLRSCLPAMVVPIGGSRLGGRPDVPDGHQWPSHDDVPMGFLAQIRLGDAVAMTPDNPMPARGLLSVFAALAAEDVPVSMAMADESAIDVRIYPVDGLHRASWPDDLPALLRFEIAELVPEPMLALPPWPDDLASADEADWDALVDVGSPKGADHRMFGHPSTIQTYYSPSDDRGQPMALLLQLDSDSISGFGFADGGRLHFWVPRDELARGDLSSCVVTIDSY